MTDLWLALLSNFSDVQFDMRFERDTQHSVDFHIEPDRLAILIPRRGDFFPVLVAGARTLAGLVLIARCLDIERFVRTIIDRRVGTARQTDLADRDRYGDGLSAL